MVAKLRVKHTLLDTPFDAFVKHVCEYMGAVVVCTCGRASNPRLGSGISVDFEEIMAHIEAAENTFWWVSFMNPKKKKKKIKCSLFQAFTQE